MTRKQIENGTGLYFKDLTPEQIEALLFTTKILGNVTVTPNDKRSTEKVQRLNRKMDEVAALCEELGLYGEVYEAIQAEEKIMSRGKQEEVVAWFLDPLEFVLLECFTKAEYKEKILPFLKRLVKT